MDGGAWLQSVESQRLSDFTFIFHSHALEKEMATHSSVFAWRIPGMGEPGGLPSMARQNNYSVLGMYFHKQRGPRRGLVITE